MPAIIYDTKSGKYVSGWSPTGLPKLTDNVSYAETMLTSAAMRIVENLNRNSFEHQYIVK